MIESSKLETEKYRIQSYLPNIFLVTEHNLGENRFKCHYSVYISLYNFGNAKHNRRVSAKLQILSFFPSRA